MSHYCRFFGPQAGGGKSILVTTPDKGGSQILVSDGEKTTAYRTNAVQGSALMTMLRTTKTKLNFDSVVSLINRHESFVKHEVRDGHAR